MMKVRIQVKNITGNFCISAIYRIFPNRSTVHGCQELDAYLLNFSNTACRPLCRILAYIYGYRNHMNRRLQMFQGSGDLLVCSNQTDEDIARFLSFLDTLFRGVGRVRLRRSDSRSRCGCLRASSPSFEKETLSDAFQGM